MARKFLTVFLFLVMVTALAGCACQKAMDVYKPSNDLDAKVESGEYVKKVDNFLVLFDASQSMEFCYNDYEKLGLAYNFVDAMNQTIPALDVQGGLRAFGTGACLGKVNTVMTYGLTDYSEEGFDGGLKKISCAGGITPIHAALSTGSEDLKDTEGPIAVILVSDGKKVNFDDDPVSAAAAMKEKYGDRVCIYTVLIGDDPYGKSVLEKVAETSGCGFAIAADDIKSEADMADWVEKIFLQPAPELTKEWILPDTFFDTDKYDIKPEFAAKLDEAVEVLNKRPEWKLSIEGHCDIRGSNEYNQVLSENRANAVKDYLVNKGIDPARLVTVGYSFSKPAAPNDSAANMAKNRRAEMRVVE
jgi:OOP family OmpA-OmpF porin